MGRGVMLLRVCLQQASRIARLTQANRRLVVELAKVRVAHRKAVKERDEARRDADLLALMARDRRVALEFVRTRHDVINLDTAEVRHG